MITLAELVVKLMADAEGYSKTFNDAQERATGLGEHIGGIAGTIGKALGGFGAYVAGSRALIDLIVNRARSFIFTTGLLPAAVAAAAHCHHTVQFSTCTNITSN